MPAPDAHTTAAVLIIHFHITLPEMAEGRPRHRTTGAQAANDLMTDYRTTVRRATATDTVPSTPRRSTRTR